MMQDHKLAALVHSQLVADVVHNEILHFDNRRVDGARQ